jgi:DNA-binding IclR family transcriptional regulator
LLSDAHRTAAEIAELFPVPAASVDRWLTRSGATGEATDSNLLDLLERLVEAVEKIAEELGGS